MIEQRKEGKNCEDLSIKERRRRRMRKRSSGGGSGGGASEFLIIATATSHLATGYTMAVVALATAWSPSDKRGV